MTTWLKNKVKQQQTRGNFVVTSAVDAPSRPAASKPKPKVPKPIAGDVGNQSGIYFSHFNQAVGNLLIGTGLDTAQWGYNLNTQVYPTYGGEVVQILSVYIDDLQIGGSLTTYSQMEAIYSYFAAYMTIATQGRDATPDPGNTAYNMQPIRFTYPARGWDFEIMPMSVPGFYMAEDVVLPAWQLTAHVVDDSVNSNPTLSSIKSQITNQTISSGLENFQKLNDEISPDMKDPNTMPFMVFQGNPNASIGELGDYYNSLIGSYGGSNSSNIPGSSPTTTAHHHSSGSTKKGSTTAGSKKRRGG